MTAQTKLGELIGQPMSGVAFVHDYVEFHFDDRVLRALAFPTVALGKHSARFPDPGSRDALCAVIGSSVVNVEVRDHDSIELRFDGGAAIRVPLAAHARVGPEAAHYVSGDNQPIEVW